MTDAEIKAVAQAIKDVHAHEPGLDCSGRMDDAKTMIAAFDAIVAFRNSSRTAKMMTATEPAPSQQQDSAPIVPPPAANDEQTNVTEIKPKSKGKKAP